MRIKLEIDRTKASNEDETVDNQQLDRISNDANWHYAFASFFLTLAIALPQISSWVESQYLVKSLQNLIVTTNTTDFRDARIAFPTVKNAPVTSGFGWRIHPITGERRFHTGIDFGADLGTPIYAVDAGSVKLAGEKGGYGNTVIINHSAGKSTLYGHASKLYVREGQQVVRGQMVAAVGSTGMSTAPHLHFEVRVNGKPVNPHPYLQQYLAGR
ncbi:M23 family metallopeptidase [Calothrix sp. PCC 6303]|uniref:M23 family metallopeptidase n=1 Tax=Calothrix sp. PCC 6303 TaxID=1170562 RepID=UPI0002A0044B|nr:M23 family metallopeptidase [Calothrix sp. PCC 6303]AFZ01535.1 Peptidase M23 [Calothrix sp. PCC 6303]